MDVQTNGSIGERSSTQGQPSKKATAEMGRPGSGARNAASQGSTAGVESKATASVEGSVEIGHRIRALSEKVGTEWVEGSPARDPVAVRAQLQVTAAQIRSAGEEAFRAQGEVSVRAAISLLRE